MKEDLIRQLRVSREKLIKIISKVSDEGVLVDKWGKREILAHLVGWEEEYYSCIPIILQGDKPQSFKISINKFNDISLTKAKNKTTKNLMGELFLLREKFVKEIKKLTDEQINSYYGTHLGKKPINVLWVIHEAIDHDNNHAKELESL